MNGGVRVSVAGVMLGLLALAGCGRGFFQGGEREPWRHEAEAACMKSGAVKLGAGVVQNLNERFDLGLRFSFDNLLGHQAEGVSRADARSIAALLLIRG